MKRLTVLFLMVAPLFAVAAQRPVDFTWENPTHDVDGNLLDADGDGDLSDGLTGYNIYRVACTDINHQPPDQVTCTSAADNERVETMVTDIVPWDNLAWSGSFNLPFNSTDGNGDPTDQHCFVMTAYHTSSGESDNSGVVCKAWKRGRPNSPKNEKSN